MRADARRNVEKIVVAAIELLAEDPSASMADVAAASGLVRATLYRHFPSREDLIRAIMLRAFDDAERAVASAEPERGPAPEALSRLIDALVGVGSRFRIVAEAPVYDEQLMQRAEAVGAPLVAVVARGQQEGSLRDDLPPRWIAAAAGALINESLRAVGRGELAVEGAAETVTATLLDGVGRAGDATPR